MQSAIEEVIEEGNKIEEDKKITFGPDQERAIISLAFDDPDFFSNIARYLEPDHFQDYATKYVYVIIYSHYQKHGAVITRGLCRDEIMKQMTVDDDYEPVLEVIDRLSGSREVPIVRDLLVDWAKQRTYSELYSTETFGAYEDGDYSRISEIIERANKIVDSSAKGLWFFDEMDMLFSEDSEPKLTTGFSRLDSIINEGGPTFGDVFCWMAPTGVGKSIMLVNSSVANLRRGMNVLHITLELSEYKTCLRYMGSITGDPIKSRFDHSHKIKNSLVKFHRSHDSKLVVYSFAPDDISVETIYALIDSLRRQHGIKIDVVVADYLELMLSKVDAYNRAGDDYSKQKRVSTELRQLAKKENVLVFTASQTNRAGNEASEDTKSSGKLIGLSKAAESYGKTMPMDYIVTINQSQAEYKGGRENENDEDSAVISSICRLFVAKNRNGLKFKTVTARINYQNMQAAEISAL